MTDDAMSALRAIAHPVRLQILSLLTGAELSATEVARELDLTHANASYHLRVLLDAGLLEVAGEERIRALAQELVRRVRHADPSRPGHYTDAELWVTPEDFEAARDAVGEASSLLHSRARPPRTDDTIRVGFTPALFQMGAEAPR